MRITKEALLSTLPRVLAEDENMLALAEPIAEELAARLPEIDLDRIYARVDELPEELLDILAYDFKADWWEYDATLEEKRAVFKKVWYVHRHKGTKGSVETAVGALFPGAAVSEWFEYGGEPYHFRMNVPIREVQVRGEAQDYKERIFFLVNYFKNLRSVLETIFFTFDTEMEQEIFPMSHIGRGLMVTDIPEVFPEWPGDVSLYLSGAMPRWGKAIITDDRTPFGLIVRGDTENCAIRIYDGLIITGHHRTRVWEDDMDLSLHIENPGLTVTSDPKTKGIMITGG